MSNPPVHPTLFELPAVEPAPEAVTPAAPKRASKKSAAKNPAPSVAVSAQAFLPGLSRRGRPRKKDAASASERAKAHRERRLAAGDKRVELLLPDTAMQALDALVARMGEPRAVVIARLLEKEGKRLAKLAASQVSAGSTALDASDDQATRAQ